MHIIAVLAVVNYQGSLLIGSIIARVFIRKESDMHEERFNYVFYMKLTTSIPLTLRAQHEKASLALPSIVEMRTIANLLSLI
jgi:hypothetical protein